MRFRHQIWFRINEDIIFKSSTAMQKAKEYDWKDSNMALFGSDVEKNVKKASAETEKAWENAGAKVGLQVWRINNFQVEHWPKEGYGKFFDGDSYIILNTYKKPNEDALYYDLHFWIGKYSTQDEYGTAAYKTVELDTLLDDKPVQHREVMEHESPLFKSYFPIMTYVKGGAKSGFRHVETKVTDPKLFHFHGDKKGVEVKEIGINKQNLDPSDVYILIGTDCIYQWNGKTCNKDEKFKATQHCHELKTGKMKSETLDDGDVEPDHPFYKYFSDDQPVEGTTNWVKSETCTLHRLSDASGNLTFEKVAEGKVDQSMFDTNDVFIFDKPDVCYVWIGKGASPQEKKKWPEFSLNYLSKSGDPCKPVTAVKEGFEENNFYN